MSEFDDIVSQSGLQSVADNMRDIVNEHAKKTTGIDVPEWDTSEEAQRRWAAPIDPSHPDFEAHHQNMHNSSNMAKLFRHVGNMRDYNNAHASFEWSHNAIGQNMLGMNPDTEELQCKHCGQAFPHMNTGSSEEE